MISPILHRATFLLFIFACSFYSSLSLDASVHGRSRKNTAISFTQRSCKRHDQILDKRVVPAEKSNKRHRTPKYRLKGYASSRNRRRSSDFNIKSTQPDYFDCIGTTQPSNRCRVRLTDRSQTEGIARLCAVPRPRRSGSREPLG